jgi:hypothetical protein
VKMDKKEIVLSTVAGLVVIVIGYLVWRHEQTVSSASNEATVDANQAAAQEVQDELASLPVYSSSGSGGGASNDSYDTGSGSSLTSIPDDTNIAAILSAFLGDSTDTGTTTAPASGGSTSQPSNPSGAAPAGNYTGGTSPRITPKNPSITAPGTQSLGPRVFNPGTTPHFNSGS